jgi:hypothetical protein
VLLRFTPGRRIRHSESKGYGLRSVQLHPLVALPIQPELERLKTSIFDTPEDMTAFSRKFDEGLKRVFSDSTAVQYVKFGSPRDNDPKHGIKAGRFMLTG